MIADRDALRHTGEMGKDTQLQSDLLHVAIVDIYLNLKKQINKYSKKGLEQQKAESGDDSISISDAEQKRLLKLGNLVLVDYVRSMIDLLI